MECITDQSSCFGPFSLVVECSFCITKTCQYNFDTPPHKAHFYTVKLGFTGLYIIFLFLLKTDCAYSLEPPRRGGSSDYLQSMFWAEIWKISSENFNVFVVKFSAYVNRHVFVLVIPGSWFRCPVQILSVHTTEETTPATRIRPKWKICVVPVSRPCLFKSCDPKH